MYGVVFRVYGVMMYRGLGVPRRIECLLGSGLMVQGSGFRAQGSGLRV